MTEWISAFFMLIGTFFMVVAAFGMFRLPDLFTRMSAATKSTTLGIAFMLLSTGVYFWDDKSILIRAFAIITFVLLTGPVAAHMIGRAAIYEPPTYHAQDTVEDHHKRALEKLWRTDVTHLYEYFERVEALAEASTRLESESKSD